jgi:phosphoserine aminotransferase
MMKHANPDVSVYIAGRVLKKLLQTYPNKIEGQQAVSDKKAEIIYGALEAYPDIYKIVPDKAARSHMNICFRVTKGGDIDASEKGFLKEATTLGLTGLKGHRSVSAIGVALYSSGRSLTSHRSVGGIRASSYNSIPLEGAEKLAKFIHTFATS